MPGQNPSDFVGSIPRPQLATMTSFTARNSRWLSLRAAARLTGLSKKTLLRAGWDKRLKLAKSRKSHRWYVRQDVLVAAPILTLGRAARLIGIHYETARRWVADGKLSVFRPVGKAYAWVSLAEAYRGKEKKYLRRGTQVSP